jgi:hypothetical protein
MHSYFANLPTYLPLLITYAVGLHLALGRRQLHPGATLAAWAFALLLAELIVGNLLTTWLLASLNAQAVNGGQADSNQPLALLNGIGIVRTLVHTLGMALLIRALFPALPNYVAPSWVRWVVGIVIGLVVGGLAGIVLGDPIGLALGISDFEGGRGYFVAFLLVPGFALVGAILGALVVGLSARQ